MAKHTLLGIVLSMALATCAYSQSQGDNFQFPSDEECLELFKAECDKGEHNRVADPGLEFESHVREITGITKELKYQRWRLSDNGKIHALGFEVTIHYVEKVDVVWPIKYKILDENANATIYISTEHLYPEDAEETVLDAPQTMETTFPAGTYVIDMPIKKCKAKYSNAPLENIREYIPVVTGSNSCPAYPSDDQIIRAYINDLIEKNKLYRIQVRIPERPFQKAVFCRFKPIRLRKFSTVTVSNITHKTTVPTVKKIDRKLLSEVTAPPREFPLIGLAQVHTKRFRCTIHIEEPDGSLRNDVVELTFDDFHILEQTTK